MKTLLAYIILLAGIGGGVWLQRAQDYYERGYYHQSLDEYLEALQNYPDQAAGIYYNMAQCYLAIDSTDRALSFLNQALLSGRGEVASRAANSIGILLAEKGQYRQALFAFRRALERASSNEAARYNYELLYKYLNPDASNPDEAPPEDENVEKDNPPPNPPKMDEELIRRIEERLKKWRRPTNYDDQPGPLQDTISYQQAIYLLEQMKKNESLYLQQLRKSATISSLKSARPGW